MSTIKPFGNLPEVKITIDVNEYKNYRKLVDLVSPNEVQWYSMIDKIVIPGSKRPAKNAADLVVYKISDIVIPNQEVTRTQVDTDARKNPQSVYAIYRELTDRFADESDLGYDEESANEAISKLHCWCHSHPFTADPKPSGQDDSQFEEWVYENQIAQNIQTPMVALIFGTSEKIHARLYDPEYPGVFWDNEVAVITFGEDCSKLDYIEAAIVEKIKERPKPVYKSKTFGAWNAGKSTSTLSFKKTEKKVPAVKEETPEERANRMFQGQFDGNWTTFLRELNATFENEKEVKKLVGLISHWMKSQEELFIFASAMTLDIQGIEDFIATESVLLPFTTKDVSDALCNFAKDELIEPVALKSSIELAKRLTAKTASAKSKDKALDAWYESMISIGSIDEDDVYETVMEEDSVFGYSDSFVSENEWNWRLK